jgi:hypothetical protein
LTACVERAEKFSYLDLPYDGRENCCGDWISPFLHHKQQAFPDLTNLPAQPSFL